jgi:hypothetical protein
VRNPAHQARQVLKVFLKSTIFVARSGCVDRHTMDDAEKQVSCLKRSQNGSLLNELLNLSKPLNDRDSQNPNEPRLILELFGAFWCTDLWCCFPFGFCESLFLTEFETLCLRGCQAWLDIKFRTAHSTNHDRARKKEEEKFGFFVGDLRVRCNLPGVEDVLNSSTMFAGVTHMS